MDREFILSQRDLRGANSVDVPFESVTFEAAQVDPKQRSIQIAFITDAHILQRKDPADVLALDLRGRKMVWLGAPLLSSFVKEMNSTVHPDAVIYGGDLIEDAWDKVLLGDLSGAIAEDKENFQSGIDILGGLETGADIVIGNHDWRNLSAAELSGMIGREPSAPLYYSFDIEGTHIVVLFSRHESHNGSTLIEIGREQRAWLDDDLAKHKGKPVFVALHHSLADQNLTGNIWMEGRPEICLCADRGEVREILGRHNVTAVINGHLHWPKLNIHQRIPHLTVPSLSEVDPTRYSSGVISPSRQYALITINPERSGPLEAFSSGAVKVELKTLAALPDYGFSGASDVG